MDKEARRSRIGMPIVAGLVAVVAAFAGSAAIFDRNAASPLAPHANALKPAGKNVTPAAVGFIPGLQASASPSGGDDAPPSGERASRRRIHCAGCGVVESIIRMDRRELASGVCLLDGDRMQDLGPGAGVRDSESRGIATLARTVQDALDEHPTARTMKTTTSYQIVVRFRDGSRRVFNEATPRAIRSGERILVIAGASKPMS
jgi:hypothetical protein